MPRIEVEPGQLFAAGGRQSAVSARLLEVMGQLEGAGMSAASAAGEPGIAGQMANWSMAWASSLSALAGSVGGTAQNLGAAAGAYSLTDASAIPR
jgi:hypothetical protein